MQTAKTAKGPGRIKAISAIISLVGAVTAGTLFNKFGISTAEAAEAQTLEPDDKKHEASALSAVADKGWTKGGNSWRRYWYCCRNRYF